MNRRFAWVGMIVLAATAHAEDVQWRPAHPLPGPFVAAGPVIRSGPAMKVEAAARIGAPERLPIPRALPDALADGPRLPPPPAAEPTPVQILPRAPRPVLAVEDRLPATAILPGPEFDRRPSPYNSMPIPEAPRPYRPHPAPTARLIPPTTPAPVLVPVPPPAPPRSQAPAFRLPPKPQAK